MKKNILNISLLLLLFSFCFSRVLRIATDPWPGAGLIYLARQQGFFEESNLEIELIYYSEYSATIKAFKSGEVDMVQEAIYDAVITALDGYKFTIIMVPVDNIGFDFIAATSEIESFEQLVGKKVGYPKGCIGEFLLYKALEKHDMDFEDIKAIPLSFDEIGKELDSGNMDAGVLCYFNGCSTGHILYSTKQFPAPNVLMVNSQYLEQNSEDIMKFVEVWNKSVKFYRENTEESVKIMTRELGLNSEDFLFSLMFHAPIVSCEENAFKFIEVKKTAMDLLKWIYTSPNFPQYSKKEILDLGQRIDSYFNNSYLLKYGYEIPCEKDRINTRVLLIIALVIMVISCVLLTGLKRK